MKYLLAPELLLASAFAKHPRHAEAFAWLEGKNIVLCPITELAFLRVATSKKAINLTVEDARLALMRFSGERKVERISDDLPLLDSKANQAEPLLELYLADLAASHGLKLAVLTATIEHPALVVI